MHPELFQPIIVDVPELKNKIGVPKNSEIGCCYMPIDTAADSKQSRAGIVVVELQMRRMQNQRAGLDAQANNAEGGYTRTPTGRHATPMDLGPPARHR